MKTKATIYGLVFTILLTIVSTALTFGRILERIDIIISRLQKIETSLDRLHDHEKRIVLLEEKVYNIEKGKF